MTIAESTYRTGVAQSRVAEEELLAERKQVRLIIGASSAIFCLAGASFLSSLATRHLSMANEDLSVASILGVVGAILMMLASAIFCIGVRKNTLIERRNIYNY